VLAVLFGALAGLGFGLLAVTIRTALKRGGDPEVGAIVLAPLAFLVSLVAAAAHGDFAHVHPGDLWQFALIGLLVPGASQIVFIQSIRLAGPSRAAILIGVAPFVSAVLAILFLGEPARAGLIIGTVIVVAGGGALAGERARPAEFRALGAAAALLCALMFGVRDNLVRDATRHTHPPPLLASAASLLGAIVVLLAYLLVVRRRELRERFRPALVSFAPSGLTLGAAYTCLIEGLAHGRVTVVAPLNATQSLWGVVFAALVVGRSEMIGRRTVLAGLLVVAGGALIGATR
jgi:drug/metabolite transporter (DMT)-like permease